MSPKRKLTALILCVFLGCFGIHRFYLGKIISGIIYLFTFGIFGVGVIYDFIMLLLNKTRDNNGLLLSSDIAIPISKDSSNLQQFDPSYRGVIFWDKIKAYFHTQKVKNEVKNEYVQMFTGFLDKDTFSDDNKNALVAITEKYNIEPYELVSINKHILKNYIEKIEKSHLVTDQQYCTANDIINFSNLDDYYKKLNSNIADYNVLWNIQTNDILPDYTWDCIKIIPKKNEILHWFDYGSIVKIKNVTKRINYGGPTMSIKIAKGVRYRMGSVSVSKETEQVAQQIDSGTFWISNQRIGFIGNEKSFTIPINKILSFSIDSEVGLKIFKESAVNPQTVKLNDYDISCSIISNIINKEA